jgi:F0F1-type ATP synthase assembly protein I
MAETPRAESKAWALTGAGFSFGAIVGVMAFGGYWLDEWLGTTPWLLISGILCGVAVATWDLIRTVNALDEGRDGKR